MKQTYYTPGMAVVRTECRDIITGSNDPLSVDFSTTINSSDDIGAPERRMDDF